MKHLGFLTMLVAIPVIMGSCDSLTTDFDTTLRTTILADVQQVGKKDAEVKGLASYSFNETHVLDVRDNDKINSYIDRLKEINVKSIECTFSGIPSGEMVLELNIVFQPVNVSVNLSDISSGDKVTLDVSHELLNSISLHLTDNKSVTVYVSGTSTYAPMVLSTLMEMPVTVTAKVLD